MTAPAVERTAARRLAGRRAQGNGAGFERWLSAYIFRPLIERGHLLRADKTDAPMKALTDHARGAVFVPCGVGGVDFVCLGTDGRYIACESKSVAEGRLYRDEILPHQAAHLADAVKAGGAAFLAVQFRQPSPIAYMVPWHAVPWATARSAQSVAAVDLVPWPLRNWLDAARLLGKP